MVLLLSILKEVRDSTPLESTWENDDDRWVYFNIPSYLWAIKMNL